MGLCEVNLSLYVDTCFIKNGNNRNVTKGQEKKISMKAEIIKSKVKDHVV